MTSKNLVIFGGTGPTGLLLCKKALDHGHKLTIYVRNPDKLTDEIKAHADAKIVHGTLTDASLISTAIAGQDAVISVLGPKLGRDSPSGVFTAAYRLIFASMREHSVSRIFALGTFSIPDARDNHSLSARLMVSAVRVVAHAAWKEIVAIGKLFDEEAEGLEWTVYRVGGLANGPEGDVRATYVGGEGFVSAVNRADVAKWLVAQVEADVPEWVGEKPLLCSPGVNWLQLRP